MSRFTPWEWDDEAAELRAERQRERRYAAVLLRHPDPQDPDWPGHDVEAGGDGLDVGNSKE